MTTIVGITDGTHVYMAADSGVFTNNVVYSQPHPKTFELVPDMLLGYSGSSRVADLIRGWLRPHGLSKFAPDHDHDHQLSYLAGPFAHQLRELLKEHGALITSVEKDDNGKELMDGVMLIGWRGKLYSIHSDFGVIESSDPYHATGAGQEFVYGAMAALSVAHAGGQSLTDCLVRALEITEHFSVYTRRPFTVMSTNPAFQTYIEE